MRRVRRSRINECTFHQLGRLSRRTGTSKDRLVNDILRQDEFLVRHEAIDDGLKYDRRGVAEHARLQLLTRNDR